MPDCHTSDTSNKTATRGEAGGVWEPYTRASEANHRVLRRSTDGATATDMAMIAQSRAMEYEKSLTDSDDEVSASDDSEE